MKVLYREYPAPMVFYKMHKAGLLQGAPDTLDISGAWELIAIVDDHKAKKFEQEHGVRLTAKFRHVPDSFARLIAKTGYCHVLCSLDPSDFRPISLPYISGHDKNLSYIVGGSFTIAPPDIGKGYVLRTVGFACEDKMMLVAEVRLYANNHTPTYHVIVGDVTGRAKVAALLKKIGDIELIRLPPAMALGGTGAERQHWMPQAWPLPYWESQRSEG